ncbi:NAD(+) synthase [Bacteriovoracaceae bacterium]|nr:NAD(+) synthase [Bacteriovoracaceae bacterium]
MKITLHQTHIQLGDLDSAFSYLEKIIKQNVEGVHLFPELFFTGYPLNDYIFDPGFIQDYLRKIEKLNKFFAQESKAKNILFLCGGVDYILDNESFPQQIRNSLFAIGGDYQQLTPVYHKQLLPNYDIFDEKKYFHPGRNSKIINFKGYNLALLICEDMWASTGHMIDPVSELAKHSQKENISIDAIINLSASPYDIEKQLKRTERSHEISNLFQCPFLYVNRVGGEDEILFDGQSFVADQSDIVMQAKSFSQDLLEYSLKKLPVRIPDPKQFKHSPKNTYESLFSPRIDVKQKKIIPLTKEEGIDIIHALKFGLMEYCNKIGVEKFIIGLSGGVDSALVAALIYQKLKEENREINKHLELIYLPSKFSSNLSYELCSQFCLNIGLQLKVFPIKFLHSTFQNQFNDFLQTPLSGITDENIQSRIRGTILMARSNQSGALVINTSNKSELSVGYSTQYGDSIGALSLIGDLYKSQVFDLCHTFNQEFINIIPEEIIHRPPTAELREDQTDDQSLPPYKILDCILEGLLSYRFSDNDLVEKLGLDKDQVKKTKQLIHRAEFKRKQFCPILKVQTKSFGFGHRVPITKQNG